MPRPRRRTGAWATGWIFAILLLAAAAVYNFAHVLGIERLPIIAAAVAPRNATTAIIGAIAVLTLLLALVSRTVRPVLLPMAMALVVGVAFSIGVVVNRGLVDDQPAPVAAGQLRILSWNTNNDLVQPSVIAALAAREHANIVVMPALPAWGGRSSFTSAFAAAGLSMTAYPTSADPSSETVVMVANDLHYRSEVQHGPRRDSSVELVPVSTAGASAPPTLMAIHAAKPTFRSNAAWNADVDWITQGCSGQNTIAIGDFNSTIDSFGESRLGNCWDAATLAHAASVGSWPTAVPPWLAMPIDHVLVTPDWRVRSFTVLTDEDSSGARHRPILTVLSR